MANGRLGLLAPDCAADPVNLGLAGDVVEAVCPGDDLGSATEGGEGRETASGTDAAGGACTAGGGATICSGVLFCASAANGICPIAATSTSADITCASVLKFNRAVRAGKGTKFRNPTRFVGKPSRSIAEQLR